MKILASDRARAAVSRHRSIGIAYVLLCVLFITTTAISPSFASVSELATLATQASFIGLVALGQTFVIIGGGVDLSVSAVISGAAVMVSALAHGSDASLGWIIPLLFAFAICIGLVNGAGVALGVSPIIMTLGMQGVVGGALLVYTRGTAGAAPPHAVAWLATHRWGPVPVDVIVWAALGTAAGFVLRKTIYGRHLYAIGSGATVARFSGVNVVGVQIVSYVISAVAAAAAGILLAGYIGQTYLTLGDPFLFSSVAAVVIGGASILGGSGLYAGTVAGALILTVLISLLDILNLKEGVLEMIYGAVILVTVGLSTARSRTSGTS